MTSIFTPDSTIAVEDVEGEAAHLGDRLRPVGGVRGVADVVDGLVRQLVQDGAGDGEPADAGVEDADGQVGVAPRATGHDAGHDRDRTRVSCRWVVKS